MAATVPTKTRTRTHPSAYRYVRKVKGAKYQARLWIPGRAGGSINLGLYSSEWAAHRAVKAVLANLGPNPVTAASVWAATVPAIAAGHVAPRVLPKWVARTADGAFVARVRVGGARPELGPFPDPESACEAMAAALAARGR